MLAVVNAADTRWHLGFECFEGPAGPWTRPQAPSAPSSQRLSASATKKCRQQTLISFIWSPGNPLPAGTGGSENYTVGQVRELTRRGLPAQVVTVGVGISDGRDDFADIPFLSLPTLAKVSELDGTVIFVNEAHTVPTRRPAFLILHNPPPIRERHRAFAVDGTRELTLIATSRYAAALWSSYLDVDVATISVVYPFAEPGFAAQPRPVRETPTTRVLFAGRLSPEKGIYTLLEMLHLDIIEQHPGLEFTATTAGADKPQGKIIERLLGTHPGISVVASCKTPTSTGTRRSASCRSRPSTPAAGSSPPTTAACQRPTAAG
jgi:D-inositol-3-phosphate glycosyltransferase